jgi:hypothetical protein
LIYLFPESLLGNSSTVVPKTANVAGEGRDVTNSQTADCRDGKNGIVLMADIQIALVELFNARNGADVENASKLLEIAQSGGWKYSTPPV